MHCQECGEALDRLNNEHLLRCSGLTVQEYAIRHRLPLDLLLHADQVIDGQAKQVEPSEHYPRAKAVVAEQARSTLLGLRWAGMLRQRDPFTEVPGEVRRLDLLLWDLEQLADYGFVFRQEYRYSGDTHRVVADNCLRTPAANLRRAHPWAGMESPPDFLDALAVMVAHVAELHAGYLFMQFPIGSEGDSVRQTLAQEHRIHCKVLDAADKPDGLLLRTLTLADSERLLDLLQSRLQDMPGAWDRFHQETPHATVSKELVFDAAHFITDHPAKCSNLHGGRYVLHVQVSGRIDPMTGCVVDYGYLKRVVNRQVVERFDHHHLNYAANELAWRSSTEMLNVHIWESLIDYLPGLSGLRLFETTQSWCDFKGPSLEAFQQQGSAQLLHPFAGAANDVRRKALLKLSPTSNLRAVGED